MGQESLRESEGQGRCDPGDFHDGHEACAHGGADLVEGAGAGDDGHGGQVDDVLDWGDLAGYISECGTRAQWSRVTYDQVRDNDLHDLCLQARPSRKHLLKDGDHQVSQWSADEGAVYRHLRHAAGEVVTMLVAVFGNPRGEELLKSCQRAGREHLGAERVFLELLQVPLQLAYQ